MGWKSHSKNWANINKNYNNVFNFLFWIRNGILHPMTSSPTVESDISDGIVTSLWARVIGVRFPAESQIDSGAHPVSYPMGTEGFFPARAWS
jgi:hypothetical protein